MRLHEDIIKQAILHAERDVRNEAVLYFSRSYTHDLSVLSLAIQAVKQHGWDEAFSVALCMTGLPLSDDTLPWILAELQHKDAEKPDYYGWPARWHTLNSLLANADAELLARHKRDVLDVPTLEDEVIEIIAERIDLLTADSEFCWRELDKFCVNAKGIQEVEEVDIDHACALCEAIARRKDMHAEKVLSVLAEKIVGLESNPKVWMETLAVRMAGEMRLEPAIPLLIGKLKEHEQAERLTEQCEVALIKIGGDGVIQAVADLYREGDWHLRMATCNVLQHIHSDLAVSTALELWPTEKDGAIRAFLAAGLADHLAFEAIEPLRQLAIDGSYDEGHTDLKHDVAVAATLMGVEFPERELWMAKAKKKELEREARLLQKKSQELQNEIRRLKTKEKRLRQEYRRLRQQVEQDEGHVDDELPLPKKKIGRNDPCPCGSGKKFKKCCIHKQDSGDLFE